MDNDQWSLTRENVENSTRFRILTNLFSTNDEATLKMCYDEITKCPVKYTMFMLLKSKQYEIEFLKEQLKEKEK